MKAGELRESFLKYFEKNGHRRVASSSLIPSNDPTLFFTNAGMVQFKDVFLGNENRSFKRAASSQKCMRVSGKHNDLENVGRTPRHHTFFEMLGNFSFGDYFKKEAIAYGWEYLTKIVGIDKKHFYVTVFKDDDAAEELWKKHIDGSKIFRCGEEDNFWAMGDTGPCGPCSEILIDRLPGKEIKKTDLDTDRFIEVWNLVFMQFNRMRDGQMEKLARPSIDTGMGLERLTAVVEGVTGNYETDLFLPIIKRIEEVSRRRYTKKYTSSAHDDISMRIIADHIRAMVFLIGDGVQPSNEGRGYVLRRIIRRAARHGKLLRIEGNFFVPLARAVIDTMGSSYPELIQHREFIEKVIDNEEERFSETLSIGLEMLDKIFREMKKKGDSILSGADVFKLYDTYGFPKDLTEDIARERGFAINEAEFEDCMKNQRERARSAWKGSGEAPVDEIFKSVQKKGIRSDFVGYDEMSSDGKILSIIKDGKEADSAREGDKISFVTDKTPFYGASGGQVGDTGMGIGEGVEVLVTDTTRPLPDLIVHHGRVTMGKTRVGDILTLAVDAERRAAIARNHTATHILHKALREVLGEHVKQAGSYVAPDRLRFDFSHFAALAKDDIRKVEDAANTVILKNLPVVKDVLPYKEAVEKGAIAFFGDKYGEKVRMVAIGDYSAELCGGTHVARSGDIGMIKIVAEGSVAAGVRRIEAVTAAAAHRYVNEIEDKIALIAEQLKVAESEVPARISKLISEVKRLEKEFEKVRKDIYSGRAQEVEVEKVGGISVAAKFVDGMKPNEMRTLADNLKARIQSGVVMIVAEDERKTSIIVSITSDLTEKMNAGNILKEVVSSIGGTGGGRPDMAQGGAAVVGKFNELRTKLVEVVSRGLNNL